jgi:ABC-type branched-subunit amino acid transport system ATPase component
VTLAYRIARTSRRVWTDMWTAGGFRRPSKVETERVDLIINNLNLSAIQHRPAMGLPLGLARLVELARSFAREPQFLLLDEASSGLDQTETDELVAVLKQMVATRGVSLLMVEHDVEMVLGMADYVYVLDFGILIAEGTPQEIRDNPKVRAAYLGEHIEEVPASGTHTVGATA